MIWEQMVAQITAAAWGILIQARPPLRVVHEFCSLGGVNDNSPVHNS